jgi:hypothetical protein
MDLGKPILTITVDEWHAKKTRGMAAIIDERPYIVTMHEYTNEPVYQPVVIMKTDTRR